MTTATTPRKRREMIRSYLCLNGTHYLSHGHAAAILAGVGWDIPDDTPHAGPYAYAVGDLCAALERAGVEVPEWVLTGE